MTSALILSCSATKARTPGPMPALEMYDGPRWRTLRAALRQALVKPRVFAFSAHLGLFPVEYSIQAYEHGLFAEEETQYRPAQYEQIKQYDELYLSMGRRYATVLKRFLLQARYAGAVHWTESQDLGYQRAQIWRYLIRYELEAGFNDVRDTVQRM